ncbi:MAG: hypothetical protein JNK66_06240 [Chitinophagales bacterium]|nr:hypothetical protein [Chitinophagales bacterium]
MRKNYLLIVTLILIFCSSCRQQYHNEPTDGGPCSYNHHYYPAIVFDIQPLNDTYSDMALLLYMNDEPDTIYYSMEANGNLQKTVLDSLHIKPGDTLTYEYMEITEGSCTPEIYNLLLERYISKEKAVPQAD